MIKVIVGDVHGSWGDFIELLKLCGAVNENGEKNPGYHIIQLGDFPNLGYGQVEHAGHLEALSLVDEALLGNHDAAALGIVNFDGFEDRDLKCEYQVQCQHFQGRYKVATNIGDWLITHAGISPYLYYKLNYENVPAYVIANDLNGRFRQYMELGARSAVISGYDIFTHSNGILWLRYTELTKYPETTVKLKQIRGHCHFVGATLDETGSIWNLAGHHELAALVTEDEGKTFKLVTLPMLGHEHMVEHKEAIND